MSRSPGTPTYTQHTVAWPKLSLADSKLGVYEEIIVSFDGKDGGEFNLSFYNFGNGHLAVQAQVFMDGYRQFQDERIQNVMKSLVRIKQQTPERVIALLEANGVIASSYHLRGSSLTPA